MLFYDNIISGYVMTCCTDTQSFRLTHSLTSGPPDFSCKTLIISFPFTKGLTSHTFSRPRCTMTKPHKIWQPFLKIHLLLKESEILYLTATTIKEEQQLLCFQVNSKKWREFKKKTKISCSNLVQQWYSQLL